MTLDERQLLLIDISARLPYGVHVHFCNTNIDEKLTEISLGETINQIRHNGRGNQGLIKPYLRPMSSMTEEDLRDFAQLKFKDSENLKIVNFPKMKFGFKGFINVHCKNKHNEDTWTFQITTNSPLENYLGIDWLNAHHFDYRGLIPKGLALEAPEGMYGKI